MSRVKRGTTALKRRKNILKKTKGYRFGRSTKKRQALILSRIEETKKMISDGFGI